MQWPRSRVYETAQRLPRVMHQALPHRDRVKRQRQAIDERVPPLRKFLLHSLAVALDEPLIPEWFKPAELRPAYAPAG